MNKVLLTGRLTRDPELRNLASGRAVTQFGVATNEYVRSQEKSEFHNIVTWGKLAEICGQYLTKGRQVYFEGRIQTRQWQDQQGQKRYTTEIVATNMQMLGGRGDRTDAGGGGAQHESGAPHDSGATVPADDSVTSDFGGGPDDDIPF